MAYAEYSEFPHSNFNGDNNAELLHVYRELLGKYDSLLNQIGDLTKRLNEWESSGNETISQMVNDVRNTLNNTINNATSDLSQRYDNSISNINDTLSTTVVRIEKENSEALKRIELELKSTNDTQVNGMLDLLLAEVEILENLIQTRIDKESIVMNNLITKEFDRIETSINRKLDDINMAIEDINKYIDTDSAYFNFMLVLSQYCFNCEDWYYETQITCDMWNISNITCIEWIGSSKYIFGYYEDKMLSPLTGLHQSIKQVVNDLYGSLKVNALTALEYDKLQLTAKEYDDKFLTAKYYDWRGVNINDK